MDKLRKNISAKPLQEEFEIVHENKGKRLHERLIKISPTKWINLDYVQMIKYQHKLNKNPVYVFTTKSGLQITCDAEYTDSLSELMK